MSAIAAGDSAEFDQALKDGANWWSHVDRFPVICIVAARCEVEMLRALLAAGAHSDATDPSRRTALMYAVMNGSKASDTVLETLIGAGCDINATDYDGYTALDWAMRFQNLRAMTHLYGLKASCKSDATIRRLIAHKVLEYRVLER